MLSLDTSIPWLSLIWLSALAPCIIIPWLRSPTAIRWTALLGALVSGGLTIAVLLGYNTALGGFQFTERLPWLAQLGISYSLGVDGISLAMLLLNAIVLVAAVLASWNIEHRLKEYWCWVMILGAGIYGVFISLDIFLLFVFYEAAVLPIFLLIGMWGSTRREYGALKLTLFLMGGSALILIGMLGIYFGSGMRTFDMTMLARTVALSADMQRLLFPPIFAGFAVLACMVPFHTWAPTGHAAAPTAASMLLAGLHMKMGAYGCLRIAIWLLPAGAQAWAPTVAVLALIGAVYGASIALVQRDLKYLIGYSSVSHMGFVMLGLAAGTATALSGAVYQMFAHGIMTALFFAVIGRMLYDRTHTRQLPELGGLGRVLPFAGVMFLIAGLSSMAMPGFAGFWAEFSIMLGVWERSPWWAIIGMLAVPVTVGYILRVLWQIFFGERQSHSDMPRLTFPEYALGIMLSAVLIGFGLAPGWLNDLIYQSAAPIAAQLSSVLATR